MNYYYLDQNGQKQGPVNDQQLQALAVQGVLTPKTPLETEGGHKGLAEQIPGLVFPELLSRLESTPDYNPKSGKQKRGASDPSNKMESVKSWLLDFAFNDIRLTVINLWACRIIYAICCIAAAITLVAWTIGILVGFSSLGPEAVIAYAVCIPLAWISVILFVFAARLACEWYIVVFDWIVETTKAARNYNEERAGRK